MMAPANTSELASLQPIPHKTSSTVKSRLIPISKEEQNKINSTIIDQGIEFKELGEYECSISRELPLSSVYREVSTGRMDGSTVRHYYDKSALNEWLKVKSTCPKTRQPITINDFRKDKSLQLKILHKYSEHEGILPPTISKKLNQHYLDSLNQVLREYDANKGFGRKYIPFRKKYAPVISELRLYLSLVQKTRAISLLLKYLR